MKINTSKFGETEIDESKIIEFPHGILGFEENKRFSIIKTEEDVSLYWLQSLDEDFALPCINPYDFFPDYDPLINEEDLTHIHYQPQSDMIVLNTIVVREKPITATANLAAPIVINTTNKLGAQFVLQDNTYKVKEPLFKEKEGSYYVDTDKATE